MYKCFSNTNSEDMVSQPVLVLPAHVVIWAYSGIPSVQLHLVYIFNWDTKHTAWLVMAPRIKHGLIIPPHATCSQLMFALAGQMCHQTCSTVKVCQCCVNSRRQFSEKASHMLAGGFCCYDERTSNREPRSLEMLMLVRFHEDAKQCCDATKLDWIHCAGQQPTQWVKSKLVASRHCWALIPVKLTSKSHKT